MAGHGWGRVLALCGAIGLASCSTCAPIQRVSVDTAPRDALIYVDGLPTGTTPRELDLRADKDHSVFLKREGYQPELVILRTTRSDDRSRLDPGEVRVRLVPLEAGRDRRLDVDVEQRGKGREPIPQDPDWSGKRTPR